MKIFSIKEIFYNKIKIKKTIKVYGWIRSKRDSKNGISFIDIFDGSCSNTLQIIAKSNLKNYKDEIIKLTSGCSICAIGILIYSRRKEQKYELLLNKLKIFGIINDPDKYPISLKKHTFEYLRKFAHLRPRTKFFSSVSRIRNSLLNGINNFFKKENFIWVPTPIITRINTEGSGSMFNVSPYNFFQKSKLLNEKKKFFKDSFLTVSGQLTLETYASALSKVYTFGPVFRSEDSNTKRHLSEFWMLEVEVSFFDLKKIILLSKNILKYVSEYILKDCLYDIEFLEKNFNKNIIINLNNLIELNFIELEYKDIIILLNKLGKKISFGEDISLDKEKYIVNKYFCKPVIIKNFPKQLKAFYMRNNSDNVTVASMDIFLPNIGEVVGGSQREERLEILDNKFNEFNLSKEKYWWYRDLRKYGTSFHSGFGIGFERLLCYIIGLENIRDASPFPKTLNKFNY
ncbi:asparagine--tRNA ligase [Buchnera aphidicola (Ceratovacuna keduensis)]|uniref:asparagine--tRNA ligase n=1 Tax=Buchnera aphidicola TaxID=9 RepID=UPI0031B7F728